MSGSAVDEDTVRAVNDARAMLGAMLSTAQMHLQKAFVVFVVGLLGTIYALRLFVWDELKAITTREMPASVEEHVEIIAVTPFDVILLQVKIGLVVGVAMAIPVVLYYSRDALRERGLLPQSPIAKWKLAVLVVLSATLFVVGVLYGYYVFFPFMFSFLATNALQAEIQPTYSIVDWTQFIALLTASFGLAAQLPLFMGALSYAGIVPYETFRDKWRHAVVGIFVFGAFFSPPDPFTQIMWAVPLLALYGASLYLSKVITTTRRGSARIDLGETARDGWNHLAGAALLAALATYALFTGGVAYANESVLPLLGSYAPGPLPRLPELVPLSEPVAAALAAVVGAVLAVTLAFAYLLYARLEDVEPATAASVGGPAAIDIGELDAAGVRAAPPEAFAEMAEETALGHARRAMDDDDPAKAQAVLDRFDAVQGADEAEAVDEAEAADETATETEAAESPDDAPSDDESGDVVQETTAGMLNAFTEEETTEDDIGGYYWDLAFILESLTSKMFRIVGLFMTVLGAVFFALYSGGLGVIKARFLSRIPDVVVADADVGVIALHPVEALLFNVKVSTIFALVATTPLVLYYAWPALKERGLAAGDRDVLFAWAGALTVAVVGGSLLGFFYVAPAIVSYLVYDAIQAGMIISYRLNNFFWLIFMTTAGIGLLAAVPTTMVMFQRGGLLTYRQMHARWREVTIGVFVFAGVVTPGGVLTMLLVAIPVAVAYGIGLAVLWAVSLGGRRDPPSPAGAS